MQKEVELILLLVGTALAVVILGSFTISNGLSNQSGEIDKQWGVIETAYKLRLELTTGLIKSVENDLTPNKDIVSEYDSAKTVYESSKKADDKVKNLNKLESSTRRFYLILEEYPQIRFRDDIALKVDESNVQVTNLSIEAKKYNDLVGAYNLEAKKFPKNLLALLLGLPKRSQLLSF